MLEFKFKVNEESGDWEGLPKNFREVMKEEYGGRWVKARFTLSRRKVSQQQFGYYYAVVLPSVMFRLADLGNKGCNPYDPDAMKMLDRTLTEMFLRNGDVFADENGEVVARGVSSKARASRTEMFAFTEEVIDWANETLDIVIPPPDPNWTQSGQLPFVFQLEKEYPQVRTKYQRDVKVYDDIADDEE